MYSPSGVSLNNSLRVVIASMGDTCIKTSSSTTTNSPTTTCTNAISCGDAVLNQRPATNKERVGGRSALRNPALLPPLVSPSLSPMDATNLLQAALMTSQSMPPSKWPSAPNALTETITTTPTTTLSSTRSDWMEISDWVDIEEEDVFIPLTPLGLLSSRSTATTIESLASDLSPSYSYRDEEWTDTQEVTIPLAMKPLGGSIASSHGLSKRKGGSSASSQGLSKRKGGSSGSGQGLSKRKEGSSNATTSNSSGSSSASSGRYNALQAALGPMSLPSKDSRERTMTRSSTGSSKYKKSLSGSSSHSNLITRGGSTGSTKPSALPSCASMGNMTATTGSKTLRPVRRKIRSTYVRPRSSPSLTSLDLGILIEESTSCNGPIEAGEEGMMSLSTSSTHSCSSGISHKSFEDFKLARNDQKRKNRILSDKLKSRSRQQLQEKKHQEKHERSSQSSLDANQRIMMDDDYSSSLRMRRSNRGSGTSPKRNATWGDTSSSHIQEPSHNNNRRSTTAALASLVTPPFTLLVDPIDIRNKENNSAFSSGSRETAPPSKPIRSTIDNKIVPMLSSPCSSRSTPVSLQSSEDLAHHMATTAGTGDRWAPRRVSPTKTMQKCRSRSTEDRWAPPMPSSTKTMQKCRSHHDFSMSRPQRSKSP